MNTKPSNPKDALGINKAPMSCVPTTVLHEMGIGMLEGALKYGRHNYRAVGVRASVYYDAAMRHLNAWWEGQDIDPESGLSHITKLLTSIAVLRDSMIRGNLEDDRPPSTPDGWLEDLNARAAALREKYADRSPKHYTIGDKLGYPEPMYVHPDGTPEFGLPSASQRAQGPGSTSPIREEITLRTGRVVYHTTQRPADPGSVASPDAGDIIDRDAM